MTAPRIVALRTMATIRAASMVTCDTAVCRMGIVITPVPDSVPAQARCGARCRRR
jgi:hypothetical protein